MLFSSDVQQCLAVQLTEVYSMQDVSRDPSINASASKCACTYCTLAQRMQNFCNASVILAAHGSLIDNFDRRELDPESIVGREEASRRIHGNRTKRAAGGAYSLPVWSTAGYCLSYAVLLRQ